MGNLIFSCRRTTGQLPSVETRCTRADTVLAFLAATRGERFRFTGADDETPVAFGAGNETRTRDPNLGKVVLYQLSYSRDSTTGHQAAGL